MSESAKPDKPDRLENDSFGAIAVPANALWGAQTQRSLEHFRISTERMPWALLQALLRQEPSKRVRQSVAEALAAVQ